MKWERLLNTLERWGYRHIPAPREFWRLQKGSITVRVWFSGRMEIEEE